MLSDRTMTYAEQVTTALLGVDALYRQESGDEEGLVVLDMSAGRYIPEPFISYSDARQRFNELKMEVSSLPEADRRRYYD